MHWSADYIGLPWQVGGLTRDGIACWGLARLVYAEQLGIAVPDYAAAVPSLEERAEIAAIFAEATSTTGTVAQRRCRRRCRVRHPGLPPCRARAPRRHPRLAPAACSTSIRARTAVSSTTRPAGGLRGSSGPMRTRRGSLMRSWLPDERTGPRSRTAAPARPDPRQGRVHGRPRPDHRSDGRPRPCRQGAGWAARTSGSP